MDARAAAGTRIRAAAVAVVLGAGALVGAGGATAAPTGAVPLMPGAGSAFRVVITDEGIYTLSAGPDQGRSVYRRTLPGFRL